MNATAHDNFNIKFKTRQNTPSAPAPHLAVQILAVIALGVVSIIAVSMAFDATWVAGVAVLALLFPLWMKSPAFAPRQRESMEATPAHMKDVVPSMPVLKPTGNASFDSYRSEMLDRLEREGRDFEAFLQRLRAARDASEFERFMDDRARKARDITDTHFMDEDPVTRKGTSGY